MRLEKLPSGIRVSADDEVYLDLSTQQYEDIFYAIPLDSSSLYLLLNGTVLTNADDRAILQFIVEANGGVDEAMKSLQDLVQQTPPPTASVQVEAPKPPEPAPAKPAPAPAKPATDADEPFEITVAPVKPAVDPFAEIVKPARAEEKPFELTEPHKSAPPAELKPAGPAAGKRPGTQVFGQKAPPPIQIAPQPDGKRVRITVGSKILDLGVVRYEDLYYAVPGDNASVYRLMNDTILNRPEERDALKDILGLLGGIDTGMSALQAAVQKVEPPPKKTKSTAPSVAGAKPPSTVQPAGMKTQSFGGTSSGPAPAPLKPAAPPVVKPAGPGIAAQPAALKTPAAPAGGGIAKPPTVAGAGPAAKPLAPATTGSKPPAAPAKPGIPPKVAGPRPFTVDVPDSVDDVELVDDVEEIPVAPVDAGRPGAPPPAAKAAPLPAQPPSKAGAPAGKPAAPAPAAPPSAASPKKKGKEIDRPAGVSQIKMSKEEIDKTGVKVKAVPGVGYQIICKEYFIQLSKAQYQELHYALPMPVMNMFKLVHNDLLKDPQSRGVLMKMIHLAGGPKDFMSALSIQVQAIKPTEDWQ